MSLIEDTVIAFLDDAATINNQYAVGPKNRRKAMRDDDGGPGDRLAWPGRVDRLLPRVVAARFWAATDLGGNRRRDWFSDCDWSLSRASLDGWSIGLRLGL